MAVTKSAYERKILWLKPIKCELIAFVLWSALFAENRKKAVALARAARRWGSVRHFEDDELATLEKNKTILKRHKTLEKMQFALKTKAYLEALHKLPVYYTRKEVPQDMFTKGALQKMKKWSVKLKPVGILAGGGVDKWYFLYMEKEENPL